MSDIRDKIYEMMSRGRSDSYIIKRLGVHEGSLRAYRAHFTRQEKMGNSRRSRPLNNESIQDIVVRCLNAGVPRESIYADPRLRGEKAQRIAGFIAAYERGAYD